MSLNNLKTRKAEISDIQQIKLLMESVFGPFCKLEELFTKWITQDQFSVFIAKHDEKLIGVCSWYLKTDNDYLKYTSFGTEAIDFMRNKKSVWVLNLAILPEYRKKGIGGALSFAQIDWLKSIDSEIVLGSSWVSGSEDNSQHLYLKAGFKKLGDSAEFLRIQMQNGAECSVCKTSECKCKSILFGIRSKDLIDFMQTEKI